MKKSLILYYSYEGNTEKVATMIKDHLDCDIESIKPIKEMQSKGFSKYFWGGSKVFMHKKPELVTIISDIESYDVLLIGTPVWAWTIAPPILSLIGLEPMKNKEVYFFYTHEGGPGRIEEKFQKLLDPSNKLISSKGINRSKLKIEEIEKEIAQWTQSIHG
jgi:flavodoxin